MVILGMTETPVTLENTSIFKQVLACEESIQYYIKQFKMCIDTSWVTQSVVWFTMK
jgi:hypothetical protein